MAAIWEEEKKEENAKVGRLMRIMWEVMALEAVKEMAKIKTN